MDNKILLKKLEIEDLYEVTEIHLASFPQSIISKLGKEAVIKYYEWQFTSAIDLYAIGAYRDDKMVGCCFGGVFFAALSGYLYRHRGFIAKRLFFQPWLFFNPTLLKKIFHGFYIQVKYSINKRKFKTFKSVNDDHHFGILEIASAPSARGLGVGRFLMDHSEKYARENNFKIMCLTVRPENRNAVQFYEHIGWVKEGDLESWQGRMRKVLVHE
ncbi:MAG: GNAT family N-acetyltransferase [Bacteroidetes bacterium]|nr:GNAT family N-acetyltransferase [Bacteroidota bacterium]